MTGWPMMAQTAPIEPAKTLSIEVLAPDPPTPKRKRTKLGNIREIRAELGRVYRLAKGGQMDINVATRLAYLLDLMARMIERAEREERVERLEGEGNEPRS
jgi:hypothetical protein